MSNNQLLIGNQLKELRDLVVFLLSKWKLILLVSFIGALLGITYIYFKPISYKANITFVVEESKSATSALGGLASLAGQFGVDVGGGGSGLLAGDNVTLYFKSTSLAREVLLSPLNENPKNKLSVADRYAEVYELKEKWLNSSKVGKLVDFPIDTLSSFNYTRLQDSLISVLISKILEKNFSVGKIDKKAGFIDVSATMYDETLAKRYVELLVEKAVRRYKYSKTERQRNTVELLQKRADSILNLLGQKTAQSASLQTSASTMDINPLYKTNTAVKVETTTRDKTILVTIFGEVTKNLELAKFTLSQETPVIQIVDKPILPLKNDRKSKLIFGAMFALSFGIVFSLILLIGRFIKKVI